jgi:hypothetical protein
MSATIRSDRPIWRLGTERFAHVSHRVPGRHGNLTIAWTSILDLRRARREHGTWPSALRPPAVAMFAAGSAVIAGCGATEPTFGSAAERGPLPAIGSQMHNATPARTRLCPMTNVSACSMTSASQRTP